MYSLYVNGENHINGTSNEVDSYAMEFIDGLVKQYGNVDILVSEYREDMKIHEILLQVIDDEGFKYYEVCVYEKKGVCEEQTKEQEKE